MDFTHATTYSNQPAAKNKWKVDYSLSRESERARRRARARARARAGAKARAKIGLRVDPGLRLKGLQ